MSDSTQVSANRAITVPFHGTELYVVEHNGQPYTPMKPIVDGMGLAWQPQHRKLIADRFASCVTEMVIQLPGDTQRRSVTSMSLRKLPGWLMGIETGKIKNPEVRARVIQYQNECDDALWQYWNDGIAINPRTAYAVNPGDKLTAKEAETLRLMLKSAVDRQPKEKQGALMMQGWSKLKAHFKVGYREIPRHEFSEAVSIIARHAADWELVDEAKKPAKEETVQELVARWVERIERTSGYPVAYIHIFQPLVDAINRKMRKSTQPLPGLNLSVRPPAIGQYRYDPANPHPANGRTIEVAKSIAADIRNWSDNLPVGPARYDLHDAAQTLYDLLVSGWTEVDEALGQMHTAMHYLNRWQGRGGRVGNCR